MTLASTVFLASIPILISLYAEKYRLQDLEQAFPNDPSDFGLPIPETFDFIIVGAGTSGCVLANRLSEKFSVLLLEAGGNPPPLQEVPFPWHVTQKLPEINFLYQSTPQKNAGLNNGGVILTTAGKMMGGSSSHNGMIYQRGHSKDFDRWGTESGDESWNYENILKHFKKSENYVGHMDLSEEHHGFDGPIHTTEDSFSPGLNIWLEAGRELDYEVIQDSNGPQRIGFHPSVTTKLNGRRSSTYTGYIQPIEGKRDNLKIYRYSYVSQVIIDEETKTVQGVQFTRHGVPRVAFAKKEVILSAGSYVSPLILIKSGIGPLDQLKAAQVRPISVLPVGQNLMDHPFLPLGPIKIEKAEHSWNMESNLTFQDFTEFIENGRGPLTGLWQGSAGAFIASSKRRKSSNPDWPDIQFFYSFTHSDLNTINCHIGVNSLQSRGSITLNISATSMADDNLPVVDFNYFSDPTDLDVAVEGIQTFLKVIEGTKAFQSIGAKYVGEMEKNCRHLKFKSDDYWKCYIRYNGQTTWHPASTCRMGKGAGDPNAVVDSKLKVIGVKNLRVVDASIMPFVTNANTFAPTLLIGEKAAADILEEYSDQLGGKAEL